jgi:hypothetical protein
MNAEIVKDVIRDVELEQSGAALYYALDTYDVISYCFPTIQHNQQVDLDSIADEQAGLDYVCRLRTIPPILPREHSSELGLFWRYLHTQVSRAFEGTEILRDLLRRTKETKYHLMSSLDSTLDKEDIRDFNVILAIALGIFRFGIQRLRWLEGRFQNSADPQFRQALLSFTARYHSTELYSVIFEQMMSSSRERRDGHTDNARRERAARVDASVIDRLVALNVYLANLYPTDLHRRHIVLYLSSAERTRRVFAKPEIQARLPLIDGRPFSFHRTYEHPFAFVMFGDPGQDQSKTLKNLERVYSLLAWSRMHRLKRQWSDSSRENCPCMLDGASQSECGDCVSFSTCKAAAELEQVRVNLRNKMENLALISKIQSYQELRYVNSGDESLKRVLAFIVDGLDDHQLAVRATAKLVGVQQLLHFQLGLKEFVYYLHPSLELPPAERVGPELMFFADALHEDPYGSVFLSLVECYKTKPFEERFIAYDRAVRDFLALDASQESVTGAHELMRAVLYFGSPIRMGDEFALRLASEMLISEPGTWHREFVFLASLASLRLRKFADAARYAGDGHSQYPEDARFALVCGMIASRLLDTEPAVKRDERMLEAIGWARVAVTSAQQQAGPNSKYLAAVTANNLAYYLSLTDWTDESHTERIAEARKAMDIAISAVPRVEWPPLYANFFHTEALLAFNEFLVLKGHAQQAATGAERKVQMDLALETLRHSLQEVKAAIDGNPKPLYHVLRQRILNELAEAEHGFGSPEAGAEAKR